MTSSIVNSITTTPKKQKIRGVVRNATEQEWLGVHVVPDKGEIIYTSDKNTFKVGDGITPYPELPIAGGSLGISDVVNKSDNIPEATVDNLGDVYMYSGESNSSFIHGYIYENQEIVTYQTVIYFEPNTIVTYNFLEHSLIDFFTEYGITDCIQIAQGSFTYHRDGNIWEIEGRDSENNIIFDNLMLYTEDLEDAGFTFTIPITDIPDGQIIEYTTRFIPSYSYEWVRLDVQPGGSGGGAVDSVNGKTGVVILDASDVGALPDTTVIPTATSDLVNDSGFITGINSSDVTSALGYTPVDPSDLSTVATTGNYNDLSNKPTIPVVPTNVSAFTNDAGYITGIDSSDVTNALGYTPADQSSLATVATTGAYSDLTGTPTIPTVNDPTIVITQGGVTKGSFSLNQASGDTIALDAGGLIGDFVPQYTTMPTADISHADQIVQYKGTTDSTYTNGYFYKCVEEGGVYSWSQVSVQPGTSDYSTLSNKPSINSVTLTGNKTSADLGILSDITQGSNITIDKTDPSNPVISATGQVNADWNSTSGLSEILNKPTLGTMAAENANDYTPTSGLATVATSGSYNDLSNKPTIPAAQVNADWNANSGVAQILNKPTLAAVATSGSYNDLSNKPTIPSVYNPTITITQGGVSKGSFTLNQSTGDTIALDAGGSTIPSTSGQAGKFLTNDGTDLSWGTATVVNFKEWGANE